MRIYVNPIIPALVAVVAAGAILNSGCSDRTQKTAKLYDSLGPDLERAYQLLFKANGDRESGKHILDSILVRAPNHPLALTYRAELLASDKQYDAALAQLYKALQRPEAPPPSCRPKDQLARSRYFLDKKCTLHIIHGWGDVNGLAMCPPGTYGSDQWAIAVEAAEHNITSVAITKRFDTEDESVVGNGVCPAEQ